MKLVIVESPSKAKTIEKYLGSDYTVRASVGHVRDLPKSNKVAIDIPGGFIPHYEISAGKEKVISELKKLSSSADETILATDPDREGEAIAWHIKESLNLNKSKKVSRVTFHEITKDAILDAMKHPRDIDMNLKEAQEARRVLDRLVGYDLSGLIWKKVRYGLSAGRVQSPALRIIMEREREIRAFIPEKYFVLNAEINANKNLLKLTSPEEPRDEKRVNEILERAQSTEASGKKSWKVSDIKETEVKRAPRPPFTTSTLQQAASTRLGMSPSRTMSIAQKLYEAGLITYMRTDSTNLSAQAISQISHLIEKKFGKNYLLVRNWKTKSKNAQEAHEAIRPTNVESINAGSTPEQKKVYHLIWMRTLASQMADALMTRTKITARPDDALVPDFNITGSMIKFAGWLKADPDGSGDEVALPKLEIGEKVSLEKIEAVAKETTPPDRYSEAGLIKELEKRGIGRPSTYASIIRTLEERGYVNKEGRTLIPTDTGDVVSSFLEKYFNEYIGDDFTAKMEDSLDEIAEGKKEYAKTLKEFYIPFHADVKKKDKESEKITDLGPAPKEFKCPICGSDMVYKLSKTGKFMSCSRFPDCNGALLVDGKEMAKEKVIGNDPTTGLPIYILDGRFGPYVQVGGKEDKTAVKNKKGGAKKEKPRRASIPKGTDLDKVTLEQALVYLSLPRVLGTHPETGETITANVGRFGPYIVHQKDFRSLKTDDVYTITLDRALEILKEEKKKRGFKRKSAE